MRLIILLTSIVIIICSCRSAEKNSIINRSIKEAVEELIIDACEVYVDTNDNQYYHIALSNEIISFNETKDIDLENFDFETFIHNSESIEFDLNIIQDYKNIKVHVTDYDLLVNKDNHSFVNNVHFKLKAKYGDKYCKGIILSQPRIMFDNFSKTNFSILVKAVRYFEYPIEEIYYLIEFKEEKLTYSEMKVKKRKMILH